MRKTFLTKEFPTRQSHYKMQSRIRKQIVMTQLFCWLKLLSSPQQALGWGINSCFLLNILLDFGNVIIYWAIQSNGFAIDCFDKQTKLRCSRCCRNCLGYDCSCSCSCSCQILHKLLSCFKLVFLKCRVSRCNLHVLPIEVYFTISACHVGATTDHFDRTTTRTNSAIFFDSIKVVIKSKLRLSELFESLLKSFIVLKLALLSFTFPFGKCNALVGI